MDPCPFVRLTVGNLALKVPVASKAAPSFLHPSAPPCFCRIKLTSFPAQTASVPYILPDSQQFPDGLAATFHLSKSDILMLGKKTAIPEKFKLRISIYTGRTGNACGFMSERSLGEVVVPLNLTGTETKASVFHNGWIPVGKNANKDMSAKFHVSVKAEPDPRYVFEFDGEPECSPQVFQIQGSIRQPVFTCKFSLRNTASRDHSKIQSQGNYSKKWLRAFGSERDQTWRERKGWTVIVHDLSGSPVAMASVVTPFVASPGTNKVSHSNPGCWLIMQPVGGTWNPWGRLEAWREEGSSDMVGYRFELVPDANSCSSATAVVIAESSLSYRKGGKFVIDVGAKSSSQPGSCKSSASPICSPWSSGDMSYALWPYNVYRGFVMAACVHGEGKCSRPSLEVGVQHVNCAEDAASFVALAAAIDLSFDACRVFTQRLRKELCPDQEPLH